MGSVFSTKKQSQQHITSTPTQAEPSPQIDMSDVPVNTALVFVKPDANVPDVVSFVEEKFNELSIKILTRGVLTAEQLESDKIIDSHYGYIATVAMEIIPSTIEIGQAKQQEFASSFGTEWKDAATKMMTNPGAMQSLNIGPTELEQKWRAGKTIKIAPSTYISQLDGGDGIFTVNGFYPAMRHQFVREGSSITWFVVEMEESAISWNKFRTDVVGTTDPAKAASTSLRGEIFQRWKELGMKEQSSMGANAIHASAGPLEGLKERMNFTKIALESDPFGKSLLGVGLAREKLDSWLTNAPATLNGQTDKAFDLTECMNTSTLLDLVRKENA